MALLSSLETFSRCDERKRYSFSLTFQNGTNFFDKLLQKEGFIICQVFSKVHRYFLKELVEKKSNGRKLLVPSPREITKEIVVQAGRRSTTTTVGAIRLINKRKPHPRDRAMSSLLLKTEPLWFLRVENYILYFT